MKQLGNIVVLSEQLRNKRPDLAPHIDGALRIIRESRILGREENGEFLIASEGQKDQTYRVNGKCGCPSYTGVHPKTGDLLTTVAPNGWCKHRIARGLVLSDEKYQAELARLISEARRRLDLAWTAHGAAVQELAEAEHAYIELLDLKLTEAVAGG